MSPDSELQTPERERGHRCWLAMQSAYEEYRAASEVLECTHHSSDDSDSGSRMRLAILEGGQRAAFERYLEARMEFLEFRFDESNPPVGATSELACDSGRGRFGNWQALAHYKPVLQMLAMVLLCTTAITLVREQRQVRSLEATNAELRAAVSQTSEGLHLLGRRLDDQARPQMSATQRAELSKATAEHIRNKPALTPPGKKTSGTMQSARSTIHRVQNQASAGRGHALRSRDSNAGAHASHPFSLSPSRKFESVGPIRASLRSVNRNTVSLLIQTDTLTMDVPRLGLNQPLWINTGDGQRKVELIIDGITAGRATGHLMEFGGNEEPTLRAELTRP
jgi:hypothetical protein